MGGDISNEDDTTLYYGFNPRPRMGGDASENGYAITEVVSIHAPVWGATWLLLSKRAAQRCFNPRPRMGGDASENGYAITEVVSIHAPVWGATYGGSDWQRQGQVSIHAPVWGATAQGGHRPSQGRVSIHAPVWGATVVHVINTL